jgi:hypothetical protein
MPAIDLSEKLYRKMGILQGRTGAFRCAQSGVSAARRGGSAVLLRA